MSNLKELAEKIKEQEQPLLDLYRDMSNAAISNVEKQLANDMLTNQEFQLASLELLKGDVPEKFHCFGMVTHSDVNVREGPGSEYNKTKSVDKNTPVIIQELLGFWTHVQLPDGTDGYIFKDYVQCHLG